MTYLESHGLGLEEAQEIAAILQEKVGEHGETEDYKDAYSELVATQTKEKLANSNWLDTLKFNVTTIDRNEAVLKKNRHTQNELSEQKRSIQNQTERLQRLESNQELFAQVMEKIEAGIDVVPVDLYASDLYFTLIDVAVEKSDIELKNSIWEKLSEAADGNRVKNKTKITEISLTPEEIVLLKKTLQRIKEKSSGEFADINESLQEGRAEYEETHGRNLAEEQEMTDLQDISRAAIEVLDQREEENGAPEYLNEGLSAEIKYQAYLKRIAWRVEQLDKLGYMKAPRGQEISRKWAMYTKMDGRYYLMNKGHHGDDVHSIDILTYRTPNSETLAVLAETMMMTGGDASLQAIIDNGVLEHWSSEMSEKYEPDLNSHLLELKNQIY